MTSEQARSIVGILLAAYPNAAIEQESVDLYTAQFAKLGSETAAGSTVQEFIDNAATFPTIAEFRASYLRHLQREQDEAARQRGLAEGPGAPPPLEWHAMMERVNRGELVRDL
jgi:hypothetical protein